MSEEPKQAPATNDKKKANSYYYWHGHEKERAAVGDVAPLPTPVLVKREDVPLTTPAVPRKTVAKYAWSDGTKFVTVYIDTWASGIPSATQDEAIQEESLTVQYDTQSLRVQYDATHEGRPVLREFVVPILNKRIDPSRCSHKMKVIEKENEPTRRQILVKLAKAKEGTWFELIGKTLEADGEEEKNSAMEEESD
ncbi:hypothetical protein AGDE_00740 [Angomonas deanei]|eukprot:EPY40174.1 hypothetical protein AGDE_03754 [Angomonas deanei]